MLLSSAWELFDELKAENTNDAKIWKARVLEVSLEQKQDKQILNQLIVDERELKELREIRNLMYCEY
jgi:hypothetical protein